MPGVGEAHFGSFFFQLWAPPARAGAFYFLLPWVPLLRAFAHEVSS